MNETQKNLKLTKIIIVRLCELHSQNKITERQLYYLLRYTCAYFIELQIENLVETYFTDRD